MHAVDEPRRAERSSGRTGTFDRSDHGFVGLFAGWLPPQPPRQRQLEASWRDTSYHCTWPTVAVAAGMLAVVIAVIATLRHFAVMRISVLSLATGVVKIPLDGFRGIDSFAPPLRSEGGGSASGLRLWKQVLLTVLVVAVARWFLRRIPEFAMWEEQLFREGCEDWSGRERAKACALFGAAHLSNLWYPLASVVALALGGGIFMWWYLLEHGRSRDRERAVKKATALHAVYNALAVYLIASTLLVVTWFS